MLVPFLYELSARKAPDISFVARRAPSGESRLTLLISGSTSSFGRAVRRRTSRKRVSSGTSARRFNARSS